MSCAPFRARFSELFDRELGAAERRGLAEHLRSCEDCAREFREYQDGLRALQDMPREPPTGRVAAAVADRVEVERRGPGLQLVFRSAWKARPLIVPGVLHGALVFAAVLSGALALDRYANPFPADAGVGAPPVAARVAPLGTEANPLFPSSSVGVPQRRGRGPVPEPLLHAEGEESVFLETVVARDGSVSAVIVIKGDSDEAQALVASLRRERFEPTRVAGRPVAVSLYRLFSRMEVRARPT